MASPPISRLRFLDQTGAPLHGPREWERCRVELDFEPEKLGQLRLLRQGEPLPVFAQKREGGATGVFAEWPLSGTGRYRLTLEHAGEAVDELTVTIQPRKISGDAYGRLIEDLQTQLPASVAIGLKLTGALSGLELRPPGESTLAQELTRLRLAVLGDSEAAGLASTLVAIARDPHQVLRKHTEWVDRDRVRRLEPVGLVAAVRQPNNLDPELRLPRRAPDVRVEQTVDVYENRLLRSFHDEVARRLRQLAAALEAQELPALSEAEELLEQLRRARYTAAFLDAVGPLEHVPTRISMVLLRRPEYRRMLQSYLRFHRTAFVQLDEPALDTPLANLPYLYELWGTLQVITVLLEVGRTLGFETRTQQLAKHIHDALYVKVLPGEQSAVELRNATTTVTLKPQRSFGTTAKNDLRSISFPQIPDVTVEVRREAESPRLILFDPKYKLDSEQDGEPGDGKPKKNDIDKMHAYRDAIRTSDDKRVVSYAAILYPGPEIRYGDGIEALSARPLEPASLTTRIAEVLTAALREPTGISW